MTIPPSAPPVLAEEPATARSKFLAALQNYETVACALDVLGASELGDAEQHVIAAFDAALLAQARQGREDAERLRETADLRLDAMETAWGIIANASGGNWDLESPHWQEAARRWAEQYNAHLGASLAERHHNATEDRA